jgi:hypothetical protein
MKMMKIVLIEMHPCNSKEELEKRERFYIESNDCVNRTFKNGNQTRDLSKNLNMVNREKRLEFHKNYYIENKDKKKEYNKQYKTENKDKMKEYDKIRYAENPDKKIEYSRKYRTKNNDKIREKIICECGGRYTKSNKSFHYKSKKLTTKRHYK